MATLVIAEHSNLALRASTLNTIAAALQLGEPVHVCVAGYGAQTAALEASQAVGVDQVHHCEAPHYAEQLAEELAVLIYKLAADFNTVIAPATVFGRNLLPRVAAMLDIAPVTDVVAIESNDTFVRPIYAGNALARIQTLEPKKLLSVRPTSFEATAAHGGNANVAQLEPLPALGFSQFQSRDLARSARPELAGARVVVSGGRGLQSAENFQMLEALADKLGAAMGASRAAVDAGYVPNDYQVGQTGKIVAPELYIAVGISGAVQHLAGMKDSKVIVAINKDQDAPIFQVADYGLVADLFQAVPELTAAL